MTAVSADLTGLGWPETAAEVRDDEDEAEAAEDREVDEDRERPDQPGSDPRVASRPQRLRARGS